MVLVPISIALIPSMNAGGQHSEPRDPVQCAAVLTRE
jgi:hypothetical protein